MINKIAYIIDYYSHDSFHEVINQGYLMMISSIYKKVVYIADKSSIDNQINILERCNIKLTNIEYHPQNIKAFNFKPYTISVFIKALIVGIKNNKAYRKTIEGADVFFNNNVHFTILLNHLFCGNNNNIFYLCHAEMELIKSSKDRGYFAHFFKYYLRFVFRNVQLRKNNKILLLSEDMSNHFQTFVSDNNKKRIFGIDHCYIRPTANENFNIINFDGIKIGIPGSINKERGIHAFKHIISLLNNPLLKIYTISTISEEIVNPHYEKLNKTSSHLPFDIYTDYIKQMDAFLLLYDLGSYQLSASGALLEAIWNERPIFAIRNAYFDYMFNKFGSLGYLADSIEELVNILNSINFDSLKTYNHNLKRAKEMLLPQNVATRLEEIIIS